ncbi:MAG: hypothetical protein R3B13_18290 [Polyangiaceae bacterium]
MKPACLLAGLLVSVGCGGSGNSGAGGGGAAGSGGTVGGTGGFGAFGVGGGSSGASGGGGQAATPHKNLYLTSVPVDQPPPNLSGFVGAWDQIDPTILAIGPMVLGFEVAGPVQTAASSEDTLTTPWNVALLRTVSPPLAAQTLSGDLTWDITVDQSAPAADYFTHIHLVAWADSLICVLADWTEPAPEHEWALFPRGKPSQPVPLQSCEVPDGARLVLELGYTSKNTHNVLRSGTLTYGQGSSGRVVTFSQDVLFR